jgi:hypothetical protein
MYSFFYTSCPTDCFPLDCLPFQGASLSRLEIDHLEVYRRAAVRPKAKRIFPEPLPERDVLMLGILSLWRLDLTFFEQGIESLQDIEDWAKVSGKLWDAPIDISVKILTATTLRKVSEKTFMASSTGSNQMFMLHAIRLSLYVFFNQLL